MFRWLFGRKAADYATFYKPKERMIFRYWDGEKDVVVDPLELYREILKQGQDIVIDIKVSRSQSKDNMKAHEALVKRLRSILKIKHVSEGGLNEIEVFAVFDTFMNYVEIVKKNSKLFSMSVPNTDVSSTTSVSENPPTKNTSDSGSIEVEQSSVVQDQSSLE